MARSTYDDFVTQERIGSGSYGVVYKVVRKLDRLSYAMKEIDLAGMSRKEQEECIRETQVRKKLLFYLQDRSLANRQSGYKPQWQFCCQCCQSLQQGGMVHHVCWNVIQLFFELQYKRLPSSVPQLIAAADLVPAEMSPANNSALALQPAPRCWS